MFVAGAIKWPRRRPAKKAREKEGKKGKKKKSIEKEHEVKLKIKNRLIKNGKTGVVITGRKKKDIEKVVRVLDQMSEQFQTPQESQPLHQQTNENKDEESEFPFVPLEPPFLEPSLQYLENKNEHVDDNPYPSYSPGSHIPPLDLSDIDIHPPSTESSPRYMPNTPEYRPVTPPFWNAEEDALKEKNLVEENNAVEEKNN